MVEYSNTEKVAVIGLVDDEGDILKKIDSRIIDGSINDPRFQVQAFNATTPEGAITWAKNNLVILLACDYNLNSKINGFELIKIVRGWNDKLPCLLFSYAPVPEEVKEARLKYNFRFCRKGGGGDDDDYQSVTLEIQQMLQELADDDITEYFNGISEGPIVMEKETVIEDGTPSVQHKLIADNLVMRLKSIKNADQIKVLASHSYRPEKTLADIIREIEVGTEDGREDVNTYLSLLLRLDRKNK